jgi:hypothetical protein
VAVAALILSIASILVTVVAVYFGKRSADAAKTAPASPFRVFTPSELGASAKVPVL